MFVRNHYHIGVCFKSEGLLPSLERALFSQNSPMLSEYKSLVLTVSTKQINMFFLHLP